MIYIQQYTSVKKNGVLFIKAKNVLFCPCCGGLLRVHGTCIRKVRTADTDFEYLQLRVMECKSCGKTHREIPSCIIPYKRIGTAYFCEIATATQNTYSCETRTWISVGSWIACILAYARRFFLQSVHELCFPEWNTEQLSRIVICSIGHLLHNGNWQTASIQHDF